MLYPLYSSYRPLMQHIFPSSVQTLRFSTCLFKDALTLPWLVSSHVPEPAPLTVPQNPDGSFLSRFSKEDTNAELQTKMAL